MSMKAIPDGKLETEIDRLRSRVDALYAAESDLDVEASLGFWSEDGVAHFTGMPPVRGREALRTLYQVFFQGLMELESTTTRLEVSEAEDLAYELGTTRLVMAEGDGDLADTGKYIAVWKRIEGEWFVRGVSFTSDAVGPVGSEGGVAGVGKKREPAA